MQFLFGALKVNKALYFQSYTKTAILATAKAQFFSAFFKLEANLILYKS